MRLDLGARHGRGDGAWAEGPSAAPAVRRSSARPAQFEATVNLTLKHGVQSALEYARTGDIAAAHRALTNPDNAPHLEFVDMGGHGYAVVTAGPEAIETEFVCIPRPIARAGTADGGPLRYRVTHRAERWGQGEQPMLTQRSSWRAIRSCRCRLAIRERAGGGCRAGDARGRSAVRRTFGNSAQRGGSSWPIRRTTRLRARLTITKRIHPGRSGATGQT